MALCKGEAEKANKEKLFGDIEISYVSVQNSLWGKTGIISPQLKFRERDSVC